MNKMMNAFKAKFSKRLLVESAAADVSGGSGGAGGGAAVADPGAGAGAGSGASGGAGNGGSAGLWGNGIRHQVKLPEKKVEVAAAEVKTDPEVKTVEPIKLGVEKKTEPVVTADPEKLTRPVMGRYGTLKEVEEAMRRSQDEGVRLYQETRNLKETHQRELATRDQMVESLKAELEEVRTHGVFKELPKEELEALAKENPRAYTDYVIEKRERDRQLQMSKSERETEVRSRRERQEQLREAIIARDVEMRNDAKNYPGYADQMPVMEQLVTLTGGKQSPFTGHPHSGEILYLASKGLAALQAEQAGSAATEKARLEAEATAKANANATSGLNGGEGKGTVLKTEDEEKQYKDRVIAASKSRWLGPSK